jgi:signal transduction histidine kinase
MDLMNFFINHNIILTAVLAFGLGVWVYFDRRTDVRNLTLSALLVAVALWAFSTVLWQQSPNEWQIDFWIRTAYLIGSFLPLLFLLFTFTVYKQRMPSWWVQLTVAAPNGFFVWLLYHKSLLLTGGRVIGDPLTGPVRPLLAIHFALLVIIGLGLLVLSARDYKRVGLDRNRLAAVVVGSIVAFDVVFAGMFTQPLADAHQTVWVSSVALLVGMFIIAASVVRNRLLIDLRLVSVEVFVLVALSVIVADLAVSQSLLDFSLRLTILLLLVFYGIMTIRSIIKEVRRLRKMNEMVEQITAMNGRLIEADRTKTQFVSLASHQLRGPLGGMRIYMKMLLDGEFGPIKKQQREILEANLEVLVRMLETIETFLNVAKAEQGKLELYRGETNLKDVADRVVEAFQPLAGKRDLGLVSNVPKDLPLADADHGKIYHVLANLIDNAIKYTEQGKIQINGWAEGDKIRLEVVDTGAGMTDKEIQHLFQAFSRGLAGVRMNSDGSGLGLYLVRRIIQAHGGQLTVDSKGKGQGSTFSFTLPKFQATNGNGL